MSTSAQKHARHIDTVDRSLKSNCASSKLFAYGQGTMQNNYECESPSEMSTGEINTDTVDSGYGGNSGVRTTNSVIKSWGINTRPSPSYPESVETNSSEESCGKIQKCLRRSTQRHHQIRHNVIQAKQKQQKITKTGKLEPLPLDTSSRVEICNLLDPHCKARSSIWKKLETALDVGEITYNGNYAKGPTKHICWMYMPHSKEMPPR